MLVVLMLSYFSIHALAASQVEVKGAFVAKSDTDSVNSYINLPKISTKAIAKAEERKVAEEKRLAEIKRLMEIRQQNINRINNFLIRKNSPVANTNIPAIIYDQATAHGADYKVLLAIMGVESGFCQASFHYNCFGFLNGVKYSSYEAAFTDIVPKVSVNYVNKFGTNFVALAQYYGMINWQAGAANLSTFYHQV